MAATLGGAHTPETLKALGCCHHSLDNITLGPPSALTLPSSSLEMRMPERWGFVCKARAWF